MALDPNLRRHSASDFNDALDDAQREFNYDALVYWKAKTYTSVASTAAYSLPSDFFQEKDRPTFDGIELIPITRAELQRGNGDDWTDDTGKPTHYIVDPKEADKNLTLYPIPTSDYASKTISMPYYGDVPVMASDQDEPWNNSILLRPYQRAVAIKAALLILEQTPPDAAITLQKRELEQKYQEKVNMAAARFGTTKKAPWRMLGVKG